MTGKPKILTSFFRYNVIALVATATDFLVFILLVKWVGLWYVSSTFISAVTGGTVAFILNRNWVFMEKDDKLTDQAVRYLLVWGGSILLNTSGLYLLVENTHLHEIVAKVIVVLVVGIGFNFLMNKFFVFRKPT